MHHFEVVTSDTTLKHMEQTDMDHQSRYNKYPELISGHTLGQRNQINNLLNHPIDILDN